MRRGLLAGVLATASAVAPLPAQEGEAKASASVVGVVFDSLAMRPLAGVYVQLVDAKDPARGVGQMTSADGRFRFDAVAIGDYLLGFYHRTLDSVGVASPLVHVAVRTPGEIRTTLAIPSARGIILRACGTDIARDSTGMLLGYVRHLADGTAPSEGLVRVQWSELSVGRGGIRRLMPELNATATSETGYAVCGVPLGIPVLVRGWAREDSSGIVEVELPGSGIGRRDIFVGAARETLVVAEGDSAADEPAPAARVLRGAGELRGTVRRSNGTPLLGARLLVWGSGVEATTNADGGFLLRELPLGTHTLEVRALGFLPVRRAVDILETSLGAVEVTLETLAAVLDTVRVRGQRIWTSPQLAEFERRRKSGFGHFMDEEAIERRNPMFVSDLFRMTPGVTITPGSGMGWQVLMRGSGFQQLCAPALFLDGMRVLNEDGNLDQFINPMDVRAVEVYTRGSNVPPQFTTLSGCGSIVIWTGGRSRRPRGGR